MEISMMELKRGKKFGYYETLEQPIIQMSYHTFHSELSVKNTFLSFIAKDNEITNTNTISLDFAKVSGILK